MSKPTDIPSTPDLSLEEMVEILKEIARDGRNGAARIAAIKELRAIDESSKPVADAFAALESSDKQRARVKLKSVS